MAKVKSAWRAGPHVFSGLGWQGWGMHVQTHFFLAFCVALPDKGNGCKEALGLLRLVVLRDEVRDRVRLQLLQLVVMNREVCAVGCAANGFGIVR